MILKILMPLCLSVLFVLSANPQSQYAPEPKQVEDVHEVVFRHFFTHDLAGSKAEAFCISSAKSLPKNLSAGSQTMIRLLFGCLSVHLAPAGVNHLGRRKSPLSG